jgi:hypothetical protein
MSPSRLIRKIELQSRSLGSRDVYTIHEQERVC